MILNWQKFKGRERESLFEELEEWVWWLRSTYPEAREAVVDCWPAHPNLVNELTALCVWWEEIYSPFAEEVPDPDAEEPQMAGTGESLGHKAVNWHHDLQEAVQRFRAHSKCTPSECVLERPNADAVTDWVRRHARTRIVLLKARQDALCFLDDAAADLDVGRPAGSQPSDDATVS